MLSKEEKEKLRLQKQHRKQLEKQTKRLGNRMERLAAFFGILFCITMVVMDTIEQRSQRQADTIEK